MKDALGHGSDSKGAADALSQNHPKSVGVPIHPAMTQEKWSGMTPAAREAARDNSDLSPQLKGLEGHRVEVVDINTIGQTSRRFMVGKSTGWKPIHLELANTRSSGGGGAAKKYRSVRDLGKRR